MFKKTGKLISLSQQNLIDCAKRNISDSEHCSRDEVPPFAFEYVTRNGGINTEDGYPYEGKGGSCRYNPEEKGGYANGSVKVLESDVALRIALVSVGPISVALPAHSRIETYEGGVAHPPNCLKDSPFHDFLLVGYGTSEFVGKYWLLKNSWGSDWGEHGYIRLSAEEENMCGIANFAYYPVVL